MSSDIAHRDPTSKQKPLFNGQRGNDAEASEMVAIQPPSLYGEGYKKAREVDPVLADAYIRNMMVGDPLADAAMESMATVDQTKRHRLIEAGMNGDSQELRGAPPALKTFFDALDGAPPFRFDPERAMVGTRAFYRYSDMFFVGLVMSSLLTGLTEGMAKAFYITGRTAGNLRRVRQNTRHIVEVTLPDGLRRYGDGWKHTVRIRMIHAQIRRLLLGSGEWDVPAEGVPLNMAHMALAGTGFSSANLEAVRKLGVQLTEEERDGVMHIWHYVTWLLGVPEELLFSSVGGGEHLRRISHLCELPPGEMAKTVAHGYINTVPEILDVTDPGKQKKLLNTVFKASRALIGNELADTIDYPKQSTLGVLALVRAQRKVKIILSKVLPRATPFALDNFAGMLQRSVYDDIGISYRMPDAVKDRDSSKW